MNVSEFQELIQLGKEGRSLEFKGSTPWSVAEFKAKITKSILAFSNVRDGGRIILGAHEGDNDTFEFVGMEDADLQTWNYDEVKSFVSEYADPFVEFSLERVVLQEKTFIVITVSEFFELPVICKRDGSARLRRGAIYTRTYRMPESAEVPTQTELREIIDLAMEKRLRVFLRTASHVGLASASGQADAERFDQQLRDFS